jgi:hypothetical protein
MIQIPDPFKENVPSFATGAAVKTTERWDKILIRNPIRKMSHRSYALTSHGEKYASTVPRSDRAKQEEKLT